MPSIYFGGITPHLPTAKTPHNLDAIPSEEFYALFAEWVTQCWLHDFVVPNDELSLAKFDLNALVPVFKEKYAVGDWMRLVPGRGATLEEYVLWLQLTVSSPVAIVLNSDHPSQPMGRIRHKLLMPSFEIGGCIIHHLFVYGRDPYPKNAASIPVMLFDGKVGHVITAQSIDDSKNWIGYDDPTWPGGLSMLCAGENEMGVDAKEYGSDEIGQWVVSAIGLAFLTYGVPIQLDLVPMWTQWAKDARAQMDRLQRKF